LGKVEAKFGQNQNLATPKHPISYGSDDKDLQLKC